MLLESFLSKLESNSFSEEEQRTALKAFLDWKEILFVKVTPGACFGSILQERKRKVGENKESLQRMEEKKIGIWS